MENCLVTKLKSTVDNDSLKKLGVLTFVSQSGFFIRMDSPVEVFIDGVSQGMKNTQFYYDQAAEHTIELKNKYALTSFQTYANAGVELSELSYLVNCTSINFSAQSASGITGNLSDIFNCDACTAFTMGGSLNVLGNIKVLAEKFPSLSTLVFSVELVTGSIEEFVRQYRAQGRTTGTINTLISYNGRITFNGEYVNQTSASDMSWTENTITFDGVTINA